MVFSFHTDPDLMPGIGRLQQLLGFEIGEGITVTAVKGDRTGVTLKGDQAVIYYPRKHLFFRELGLLVQHARKDFALFEDDHFEGLSVMLDASRCAVPTVETVNRMVDYLAVLGYSMAMLYTEDTVQLENRPYFGYMRGRYTAEELRAIDDYAFAYGIEIIPCLECYGHMHKYLIWPEAAEIKDTDGVLLAREEKTFAFLEELISAVSSCFRSRRIHIGMDEAWDMGRGKFLDRHGYVPPFEIFNEYMERLIGITNKYGLTPMMWSDMYFRIADENNKYYSETVELSPEVAAKIPEEVELVFWHYGEKPYCDDYMLKKHMALGRKVIYAGGSWSWIGHFPEHHYTMETTRFSLNACRSNGVREAMLTLWFNDNAECDLFANLFSLSYFAELAFDPEASEEKLRARFEASTGGSYGGFLAMSNYHNDFLQREYPNFHDRFLGKHLFWQDVMEGLYDTHLFAYPMSGHYAASAAEMKVYSGRWSELYDFAYKVFDYLAIKCLIAENLVPAYQAGNRERLAELAGLLALLKEKTSAVHLAHKALWNDRNKVLGWANMDVRYGGMAARCDTARERIEAYLEGSLSRLEELEEPRLHKIARGFNNYSQIVTVNLKI
ncbi:MAG: family 20 glycosylhydrolase [Clostridia bacterium]|nr:family 20 glycosylhydrolase [Clostridia bacterium]